MNTKNLDYNYNHTPEVCKKDHDSRLSICSELQSCHLFTHVSSPSVSLESLNLKKPAPVTYRQHKEPEKTAKYGELVLLGYNGCINHPSNDSSSLIKSSSIYSSRRKSKFLLQPREKASGVKASKQINYHTKHDFDNAISKSENHSVTYTLSRTHQVVVQYVPDEKTDMFQIGRSAESAIDFIVLDTNTNTQTNNQNSTNEPQHSTISRYSCRIIVDREYPYTARIYAAGFDSSKRIFLGEKVTPWKSDDGSFDGVTTNGVLILHPQNGFTYNKDAQTKYTNEWMEVSVCGAVIELKEKENRLSPPLIDHKNHQNKDPLNKRFSNILRDGTLIDLCGATLLWRTIDSLANTPDKDHIELNLKYLNYLRPQCPVGFKTLVFPSSASPSSTSHLPSSFLANNILLNNNPGKSRIVKAPTDSGSDNKKHTDRTPMVYLKCGHIHGQHDWGIKKDNERECPLCRKVGPYIQILIGIEPSFYCDSLPTPINNTLNHVITEPFKPYAFLPCGHMASEVTCRFWSQIKVPQGATQQYRSLCPFCAVILCEEQPIVKLILQEGLQEDLLKDFDRLKVQ